VLRLAWQALLLALALGWAPALVPGAHAAAPDPVWGRSGMVVSSVGLADRAGLEMLAQGGNAIDAALAAGFAAGVINPFSSGLGGGAFVLVHVAKTGETFALDARETAPAATRLELYLDANGVVSAEASKTGGLAVAVPSLVPALLEVHQRYGRLPRERVLAPAIRLCREGVAVTTWHQRMLSSVRDKIARFPETASIQLAAGKVPPLGWRLVQPDLARTHQEIATRGADALRRGRIADAIVSSVREAGGVMTAEDLASYRSAWRQPVSGSYRGFEIRSFPPPSSGGVHLVEMLNTLEPYDVAGLGAGSSDTFHLFAEAMKLAFADRAAYGGDPDFQPVPVDWLTSKAYGLELAALVRPRPFWKRPPWEWGRGGTLRVERPHAPPPNDSGTTHISVLDAEGNAVALSQSINTVFGSGLTAVGTGIVLNNHMDDFAIDPSGANAWGLPGGSPNRLEPGKRPLSSMTPTIVLRDGKPVMIAGSPGGPLIITAVLQALVNAIDFGMNAQAAVSFPRVHHQWRPDVLLVEPDVPRDVVRRLEELGHPVQLAPYGLGAAQLLVYDPATGLYWGGADPRRSSSASGL
jgi:gamma-glutamyltranspeptidase/glutathione hydrolase